MTHVYKPRAQQITVIYHCYYYLLDANKHKLPNHENILSSGLHHSFEDKEYDAGIASSFVWTFLNCGWIGNRIGSETSEPIEIKEMH